MRNSTGFAQQSLLHPKTTWYRSVLVQANPRVREVVLVTPDEVRRVRRSDITAQTLGPALEWQRSSRQSDRKVPEYFTAERSPSL